MDLKDFEESIIKLITVTFYLAIDDHTEVKRVDLCTHTNGCCHAMGEIKARYKID